MEAILTFEGIHVQAQYNSEHGLDVTSHTIVNDQTSNESILNYLRKYTNEQPKERTHNRWLQATIDGLELTMHYVVADEEVTFFMDNSEFKGVIELKSVYILDTKANLAVIEQAIRQTTNESTK